MNNGGLINHGGNLYAAIRQSGGTFTSFLDFSANINPLGLSSRVREAIIQNLEYIVHYPDADAAAFKRVVSEYYDVPEASITPGNGAVEMLFVLCNILRPRRVLVTAPAFSEYERAARAAKAEMRYLLLKKQDGFAIDIDEVIANLSGVDMLFLGNPNNPTGTLLPQEALVKLLAAAENKGIYTVVDESFMDFLIDDRPFTCRPLIGTYNNLVIIHSLTKFYAIPGLRLGFALASAALTRELHNGKDPWNVNSLAQSAGVAALGDMEYREKSRRLVQSAGIDFYSALRQIPGCMPLKPSANFILVNIAGTGHTGAELRVLLAQKGILIRDCGNYRGLSPAYIRLAVRRPEENRKVLEAISQVVGAIG
ncbi:MAG: threonine-phosphate decarboxylase CobD [Negativicutes bacterium]|nr:threonine-phosphate decarboxylase CobD [Negativicutes bacterium]